MRRLLLAVGVVVTVAAIVGAACLLLIYLPIALLGDHGALVICVFLLGAGVWAAWEGLA